MAGVSQSNQQEKRVFFSMSMRFIVPVEHANMIGTIASSNITKHRFINIPVPVKKNGKITGYRLVKAPAISGQALLNAYERALVDYCKSNSCPVDQDCGSYVFVKHTMDKSNNENEWIENCVVEDVTGYLAPNVGARKTSTVWFSFVVPDFTMGKALLDYQIFARYASEQTKEKGGFIGQRESGHAVYRLSVAIDVSRIGFNGKGELVIKDNNERADRVKAAFRALMLMFSGGYVGANRTRALMLEYVKPVSLVAAVSVGLPFMVSPAEGTDYIVNTCNRAMAFTKNLNAKVYLYYFVGDADAPSQCGVTGTQGQDKSQYGVVSKTVDSLEKAIEDAMNKVLEEMGLRK